MTEHRKGPGYYIRPLRWVGEPSYWGSEAPPVESRRDLVHCANPAPGLEIRTFRDGLVAFDVVDWIEPPPVEASTGTVGFDAESEYQVQCLSLMRAHLACLSSVTGEFLNAESLSPSSLLTVDLTTGDLAGLVGDQTDAWEARYPVIAAHDRRVMRHGRPLPTSSLGPAAALLRQVLERPAPHLSISRVDLLHRAAAAYAEHDYPTALVHAWTVTEGLLSAALEEHLGAHPTMNARRREFLLGSQMTSRHTAEFLELTGVLAHQLYKKILIAARARNDWLHAQRPVGVEAATVANVAAQSLLQQVEGLDLSLGLGRVQSQMPRPAT